MKNSTRVILIVICLILSLFLIGVLVWGILFRGSFEIGEFEEVKEEHFQIDKINEVIVKTKSANVIIYRTEDSDMKVIQKSRKKGKEEDLFQVTQTGESLKIEGQTGKIFCLGFCFWRESVYEIYLPKSYHQNLTVESASGDIELNAISEEFKELNLLSISGDISLHSQVKAENIELKSTSGDINTISLKCEKIVEQTVSGDIVNENVDGEEIILKSTSGDIENRWLKGSVDVSTISGEIEFDYLEITGDSNMKSTSGDIEVMMGPKSSVKMHADSVSGDIHFPHSESILGEGKYMLTVHTISGDIDLRVTKY